MNLKESNEYLARIQATKKIDMSVLEALWKEATSRQEDIAKTPEQRDKGSQKFWVGVKKIFDNLISELDLHEAKEIIMNRDEFKDTASSYLDSLQKNDYVNAQSQFKKMVDNKLSSLLDNRGKEFLKTLNQKAKPTTKK